MILARRFNRRSGTTLLVASDRGLKPTATVGASLREDLAGAKRCLLRTARMLCDRQLPIANRRALLPLFAFLTPFLAACLNNVAAEDGALTAGPASVPAAAEFFEKRIRPLLAEHCYQCHSAESEKLKGKLMLDSQEGLLKGGETGPAVVPGDPERSLLIKAVRYTYKDLQMPPKNKKLFGRQISDLAAWVKMGAPWPAEDKAQSPRSKRGGVVNTDKDRAHFGLQTVPRAPLPPP